MPFPRLALATVSFVLAGGFAADLTAQCGGTAVAAESQYNGSNVNTVALDALNRPILGASWDLQIDHTAFMPGAIIDFYVLSLVATQFPVPPYGEVLVGTPNLTFWAAPPGPLSFPLPADASLCGAHLFVQGASFDGTIALTNGVDGLLGDI